MEFILYLPILFFSVIAHEFAHGYAALRCGDDTAYVLGRLNFNPLKHVDIAGTILVPLILYSLNAPLFGWAKPVPVNFYRLRGGKRDIALVSLAGPLTNICLMLIAVLLFKLFVIIAPSAIIVLKVLLYAITINLVLAVFNLVPIPPLDGSKIVSYFLPDVLAAKYMRLERYGFFILIILVMSGALSKIVTPVFNLIFNLIFSFIGVPYGLY